MHPQLYGFSQFNMELPVTTQGIPDLTRGRFEKLCIKTFMQRSFSVTYGKKMKQK